MKRELLPVIKIERMADSYHHSAGYELNNGMGLDVEAPPGLIAG
jgi:hypothetical protein